MNADIMQRGEFARLLFDPPASAAQGSPEAAPRDTISSLRASGQLRRAVALPSAKAWPFLVAPSRIRERRAWYSLTVATHSAAAFDAWTTRRVIESGLGHETNPLLKRFANSNGLYAAVQVGPTVLDYVGHRLMIAKHRWLQKMWWVPQLASTGASLWGGAHNLHIYHRGKVRWSAMTFEENPVAHGLESFSFSSLPIHCYPIGYAIASTDPEDSHRHG